MKVSAGTSKYISLLETFLNTMRILNRMQGKLIIMPLNVISFATAEVHMYYIMINTNKVQIKQNDFLENIVHVLCFERGGTVG